MKKGFTLIELLVVVLIIGILAAVAAAQYQTAVLKSRAVEMLLLGFAARDAQKVYFLANGRYAADIDSLDLSLPAGFVIDRATPSQAWRKGSRVEDTLLVDVLRGGEQKTEVSTQDKAVAYYFFINTQNDAVYCTAAANSRWERVCKTQGRFGGAGWFGPGNNTYILN